MPNFPYPGDRQPEELRRVQGQGSRKAKSRVENPCAEVYHPRQECQERESRRRLVVDAAIHGDRRAALQCLLVDQVITDLDIARQILDDYLLTYRDYLPQFWR